jgi:probable HAF family extracellular repeat protein
MMSIKRFALVSLFLLSVALGTNAVSAQPTMVDLGTVEGLRVFNAAAINEKAQIVGQSFTASGASRAYLWEGGAIIDLGTLGGSSSRADGINDCGQIVGMSETASGEKSAFIWENGTMSALGTLGGDYSSAAAINDFGQVVGQSEDSFGDQHGYLLTGDEEWLKENRTNCSQLLPRVDLRQIVIR